MKTASKALSFFLMAAVLVFSTSGARAQQASNDPTEGSPLEVRNAMGTILLSGLVGGILGLSTLSFYSKPQDNIRNIFFGAGAGMIVATLWMTANVATSPLPSIEGTTWVPMLSPESAGVMLVHRF